MSFFNEIDEVWDAYIGQMERFIRNDTHEPMQLYSVSHALPIDFEKYPKFSNGLVTRESDVISEFGSTFGIPRREAHLEEAYGSFLLEIVKGVSFTHMSPAQQKHQGDLSDNLDAARGDLNNFKDKVEARWSNYRTVHHIPTDDKEWIARDNWERKFGYDVEDVTKSNAVQQAAAELWAYAASMIPPNEAALVAALSFWNHTSDSEAYPPSTGYENDPNQAQWGMHRPQTIGANWDDFYKNDAVRSLTIDEHSTLSTSRKSNWNADGGWSGAFVSINAGGSGSTEETTFRDHIKKIEISFSRLEEYQVVRGPWFQPALFRTYGKSLQGWWGPSGLIPCYPITAILARGLTITLHVEDVVHDTFKKHVEGSGGISIGPWHVGGGGGEDSSIDDYREQKDAYVIKDAPGLARIIGIRVGRPNFEPVNPLDFEKVLAKSFKTAS